MPDDPKANASAKPAKAPGRLRPTIIEAPVKRAKSAPTGEAVTPKVMAPTAIPGVARKRIEVTSADVARLSPGVAPKTAARAVRLVDGFVVEDARDQHVAAWGQAAQQRCASLVSDAPAPPQAEVLGRAHRYMARIVEILGAIDIAPICDARRAPLLGILEPASTRIDTARKFAAARAELEQLVRLARAALDPLRDLKSVLEQHSRHLEETGLEIEAAALAALFLSDHLASLRPDLSRRFLQREMSLTQTVLRIRGGQLVRASQVEEPLALITAIQDVVLTALPDWLADIAGVRGGRRRLTPTEAGELQHRLRALLRQLDA